MKKLIKKILRESEDDELGWMREIKPPQDNVIIYSNSIVDRKDYIKILQWIENTFPNAGWSKWESPTKFIPKTEGLRYIIITNNQIHWGGARYDELLQWFPNHHFINIDDIFVNDINESMGDDLSWLDEISSEPDWSNPEFNIRLLDGFKFTTNSGFIYSFSYDGTPRKDETLIYDTRYKPNSKKPSGEYNGAPWTWDDLREHFLQNHWKLVK